jgi:hypothetical protein
LGCLGARDGAPPLGKLFRHGVLVKTYPRLLWEGNYLPGPAAPGIPPMAAAGSSGLHGRHLGCFAHPGRSGGNDHGSFVPISGYKRSKNPSGRPDLNRRPLDPQECIRNAAACRNASWPRSTQCPGELTRAPGSRCERNALPYVLPSLNMPKPIPLSASSKQHPLIRASTRARQINRRTSQGLKRLP